MLRFGPAGIPVDVNGGTLEGVLYTASIGLNAFECEFVRGVKMKASQARQIGAAAKEKDVLLSAHCPYWINSCARERVKIQTTMRNILQTARVASAMGAWVIVFHPGFYQGRPPAECIKLSISTLKEVKERMKSENLKTTLGLETTGKGSQLGTLEECIEIANAVEGVPVIDFAHIHGRTGGSLKRKEDYAKLFDTVEKQFGARYLKNFHSHFSELEYTPAGERRHIPVGMADEPPFKPLAEVIVENGYGGTIISESPLLEEDALKMKRIYERALKT